MPALLINADEVKKLLTMKDAIRACEETFRSWGMGQVVCPPKVTLELGDGADWPPYKNSLNAMPAYIHSLGTAGVKCVSGSLNNPGWGLPYIIALVLLFDPATGIFKAVVDGEQITNYRTGAQSAVAAKYLVKNSNFTLGICGAGAQGRTQLMAFAETFSLKKVVIYDICREHAVAYKTEMSTKVTCPIEIAAKPEDVCAVSDVVISVTHARDKFIRDEWVRPGTIVFPMGSFSECSDELLLHADRIIVDSVGQTLHRGALHSLASQGKLTEQNITCTIGDLVCGKSGRIRDDERVVCIPIGTGAMDVAVAEAVYRQALEKGMGTPYVFNNKVER